MAFHVEDDEKLGARFRSLPRRGWGAPGLWLVPVLLRRLLPLSTSTSWALLLGGSASAATSRLLGPGPILAPSRPAPTSSISRPGTSSPSVPRGPATSRLFVRTEHKVYHKCTIIVCMRWKCEFLPDVYIKNLVRLQGKLNRKHSRSSMVLWDSASGKRLRTWSETETSPARLLFL